MKVNFNQLRRNIASAYNDLARQQTTQEEIKSCEDLRLWLFLLLELHNPDDPNDSDVLIHEIDLVEPRRYQA